MSLKEEELTRTLISFADRAVTLFISSDCSSDLSAGLSLVHMKFLYHSGSKLGITLDLPSHYDQDATEL